jgi:hypothetical protein
MTAQLQNLIAEHEAALTKLKAAAAAVPAPMPSVPSVQLAPPVDFQAIIRAEMARLMPQAVPTAIPWKDIFTALAKKSLDTEQFGWLQQHIASGAPGSVPFLDSSEMVALVQMAFAEYKEFLARPPAGAAS